MSGLGDVFKDPPPPEAPPLPTGLSAGARNVANGNIEAVEALLQKRGSAKLDVNQKCANRTLLGLAAERGQKEMVDLLLAKNADVASADDDGGGSTPLHLAAKAGQKACLLALLRAGANINALDGAGHTPLWVAVTAGMQHEGVRETAMTLVDKEADVTVLSQDQHVALHRWEAQSCANLEKQLKELERSIPHAVVTAFNSLPQNTPEAGPSEPAAAANDAGPTKKKKKT